MRMIFPCLRQAPTGSLTGFVSAHGSLLALSLLRGGCWMYGRFPGAVTIEIVVLPRSKPCLVFARAQERNRHLIWNVFVELTVVWASVAESGVWTFRGLQLEFELFLSWKRITAPQLPWEISGVRDSPAMQWRSQWRSWHTKTEQLQSTVKNCGRMYFPPSCYSSTTTKTIWRTCNCYRDCKQLQNWSFWGWEVCLEHWGGIQGTITTSEGFCPSQPPLHLCALIS